MPEVSKIFFSVGEPSGDLHAANLIKQIRLLNSSATFRGLGGPTMSEQGCYLDYELTNLAVVGFAEVLPKLREFFRVADLASKVFDEDRPDAVVLVDFPGFNWHIAKRAKQRGIPVFYYLPPQLWAWGAWRLRKLRQNVDHVLCNLPFEPEWYGARKVEVEYVGHPFFDEVAERPLDSKFLERWRSQDQVQVAVLPGSRTREVTSIWPMQLQTIRNLSKEYPGTRFLVACLKPHHCKWCVDQLKPEDKKLDVQFFAGKTSEIIEIADCSLMKSGSVSLEMMARTTPAVVVYHASRTLYTIGKMVSNLESMTLPNLIAGETIMPEYLAIGSNTLPTIQNATQALGNLIGNEFERTKQAKKLKDLREQVATQGASRRAARVIANKLGWPVASSPALELTKAA